ncbi:MAG: type II toxin-antitoxin system VapC family toxin [Rhodocyclaceae bacterium]|nr:type II toxin-antitoxin system VapC family toxin [Rhodocyclaceae bacterium]MBX3667098.1 type II toxin-antitoxin system VapC family toxin [Rhodocyclaceae bacterium]
MRPLLVDTNAYAAFMRGEPEIVEVLARCDKLLMCSIVLGELLAGFSTGSREAKNRQELHRFLSSPRVSVLPVTADTADYYALVYAALRRKGRPIPTNDLWIAACALQHSAGVVSLDAHFAHVDGLKTGRTVADFLP